MEFDLTLDELFEEFEGKEVEMCIGEKSLGKPIKNVKSVNWITMPEEAVDPDYQFASPEACEKFLDMKFGMMIHWGQYSVMGLIESWGANQESAAQYFVDIYYTLYQVFNPTEFSAAEWADLAVRAGMQFFVFTTKHHDGFCLFDTKTKTKALRRLGHLNRTEVGPVEDCEIHYSMMDTPYKVDIVEELVRAFRKRDLGIGLYFSHIDWNDPNFRWDPGNRCYDPSYNEVDNPAEWQAFINREREQLRELLTNYGPIDQVFFDGTWWDVAWDQMKDMFKEIRKLQPHCLFNDRGLGPYGDFTCPERWIPEDAGDGDERVKKKVWQVCDPIGTHWSHVPGEVYKDKAALLRNFVDAVAKGGTYVFAIAPMANGKFDQETVDILEFMGRWLAVNGEAIYATRAWERVKETDDIYFTRSKDNRYLFAIHFGWPSRQVELPGITPVQGSQITLLGIGEPLPWKQEGGKLLLGIPAGFNARIPCEQAFCFKIQIGS